MRVLALETSSHAAAVAVAGEEGLLGEVTLRAGRRHVELVHAALVDLLALAELTVADLDAVAVDVGPGLFTGIRVGVAAAKGLAMARRLPCVGVTSLAALAHGAGGAAGGARVVPVVDLRRGEVAWSAGDELCTGTPGDLVAALEEVDGGSEGLLLAGDGARYYAEALGRPGWRIAGEAFSSPPVASVALLGVEALLAGRTVGPAELAPVYLREADARINWTTRHDAPGSGGG